MKYALIFMCDNCEKQGRGQIVPPTGMKAPEGWAHRVWPNGQQTLACSKDCAVALTKTMAVKSLIVPRPLPVVRGRAVSLATKGS